MPRIPKRIRDLREIDGKLSLTDEELSSQTISFKMPRHEIQLAALYGEYVMGIHGKDGKYPTDGHHLGDEVPLGQGKVNYPAFIAKLKEVGYEGDITIEREIDGDEQKKDIRMAKDLLDKLIAE